MVCRMSAAPSMQRRAHQYSSKAWISQSAPKMVIVLEKRVVSITIDALITCLMRVAARERLPKGDPVWVKGEGDHHAWQDEAKEDADRDGLSLLLSEGCGAAPRPTPAIADGRGEPDGEEVAKRGRALELVHSANDKVGYEDGAIRACALYDEGEDDGEDLGEEVDDMGIRGRVEGDGEEVDKDAEDLVGNWEASIA
jgi:hypothetical protein